MDNSELRRTAREAFRQMDEGRRHLTIDQIALFLKGKAPESQQAEAERHLMECAECRERREEFAAFLADSEEAPETDLEEEWRGLERQIRRGRVIAMPRWAGIAAAVAAICGLSYAGYRMLAPAPARLLAQAYREQRSFDLRIAGAGYAPIQQQRGGGSAFGLPTSLLKAQARLAEDLKNSPDDPQTLRLKGEAEMIAGDASEAVRTLERARDLSSGDSRILADLGAAYALRGDAAHQFGDYSSAFDLLDRSLRQHPGDAEVLFNRALVLEKMLLYPEAEIEWQAYLKADSSSGWAKEARARLAAIEEKLKKREKAEQLPDDPEYFLKLAGVEGVDAEAWLISPISTRWLQRSRTDPAARKAVLKLAGILAAKHGDTWLEEMTADSCAGAESIAALGQLLAADGQANRGGYAAALVIEERVTQSFLRAGCGAGAFRARLSQLVALQGSSHTEDCVAAGRSLSREVERHPYIRLRARVARVYGVCAAWLGQLDEASAVLHGAWQMSRRAGYGATALDLWNMDLDKTTNSGLPSEVLAKAGEAMRIFWSGSYSRGLLYPTLQELWLKASRSQRFGAALRFARTAVWATSGPEQLPIWQVGAYGDLAVAEQELGEWSAARTDLESSNRIAGKLSPTYGVATAVALARFDLKHGDAAAALARLKPLDNVAAGVLWVARADYYTALGEALARNGSREEAIAAFRQPIDSGAGYLASVKSEDERAGVLKGIETAYRGLVAAQLAVPGNETAALGTWRSFRNFDAPRDFHPSRKTEDPVLWFLELRDGFVAWFSRGEQITFHRLEAPNATVRAVAARFLLECSEPRRSADALRADALALYRWMVEPFSAQIGDAGQGLVFELDGALAGLPVQALMSSAGEYLGDRFPVLVSTGRAGAQRPIPGTNAKVLVVVNPAITGASASRFPPLADSLREAGAIRASFANSVVLEGRDASVDSLAREIPNVDIIHFAGHGYSDSGNGALLFASQDPAADYQPLRAADLSRMDWSRCALAVLSACAAAEGETHGAHNPESLIRAIAKAGASRVAASLWNVDSAASAELMAQFYAGLKSGEGPAEALRTAQRAIRRNSRWAHPYYWAGFQLYGTT